LLKKFVYLIKIIVNLQTIKINNIDCMSRICQITGKRIMVGNNVSHSKRRTKRLFLPNLFYKKFFLPEENKWIKLKVSAQGMRLINKIGLKEALERAVKKGYIKSY